MESIVVNLIPGTLYYVPRVRPRCFQLRSLLEFCRFLVFLLNRKFIHRDPVGERRFKSRVINLHSMFDKGMFMNLKSRRYDGQVTSGIV